jgi:hypothetical protein
MNAAFYSGFGIISDRAGPVKGFAGDFTTNFAAAVHLGRVFSAGPNETVVCAGCATRLPIIPRCVSDVKDSGHQF